MVKSDSRNKEMARNTALAELIVTVAPANLQLQFKIVD